MLYFEHSRECYCFNILGNVIILTFYHFNMISGNVPKYSGHCSKRFRGMFKKIPGNLNLGLLCEILLVFIKFCQIAQKLWKNNNCWVFLLKEIFSTLLFITNLLSLINVFFHLFSFFSTLVCLIASAKFRSARRVSRNLVLRSKWPSWSHMPWFYLPSKWIVEMLWSRGRYTVKKMRTWNLCRETYAKV